MAENRIQRKELWRRLPNLKKTAIWLRAAKKLGLVVTQSKGGTSHYALRLPNYEQNDIKGLVVVVYAHGTLRKDVNEKIFKAILNKGFTEDQIWEALGFL